MDRTERATKRMKYLMFLMEDAMEEKERLSEEVDRMEETVKATLEEIRIKENRMNQLVSRIEHWKMVWNENREENARRLDKELET